ncbi:MAG: ABC transporter ATP-binding protein [Bacteroidetes bacterium]|nr:ABC transporter ATP-binding protein [Bacteroidota bacterium]
MESILTIRNLNKHYGHNRAVDDISFSVEKGSVYGLLGPNGSGKTTTLGMILGVIQPLSGQCNWFGQPVSPQLLKRVGAVLEQPNFYPYLSGIDNLKIVADIKSAPYERIAEVLELVELGDRGKHRFKTYSLGMKQRLAIAGSMINQPEVLVLDEPTNGLDPEGIIDIRKLIVDIAAMGTTIILASHLLDEVERVCSHVGVLRKGKLLFSGRVDEIAKNRKEEYLEMVADDMDRLVAVLNTYPGLKKVDREGEKLLVFFEDKPNVKSLNQFLMKEDIVLTHLAVKKPSLENQFLDLIKQPQKPKAK